MGSSNNVPCCRWHCNWLDVWNWYTLETCQFWLIWW
jgi:hypothetical protein